MRKITRKPVGDTYAELLGSLTPFAATFGLVMGAYSTRVPKLQPALLDALSPYLLSEEVVSEWPGGQIEGPRRARRNRYTFNSDTISVLLTFSESLYDWQFPLLPNDLHLLRSDGTTVLGSISVEDEAWLELSETELERWCANVSEGVADLISNQVIPAGRVYSVGPLLGSTIGAKLDSTEIRPLIGALTGPFRERVAEYLSAGTVVLSAAGTTSDVLQGQFEMPDGADILSDGAYIWRRDSALYVSRYGVEVSADALLHFESVSWELQALSRKRIAQINLYIWTSFSSGTAPAK
jgi:hypothetical protein